MREVVAKGLAALTIIFDVELSEERSALYAEALRPFTDKQIEIAVQGAINTCKFFPRPAELRDLIPGPDALPGYVPVAGLLPPPSPRETRDMLRLPGAAGVDLPPRVTQPEAMAAVLDRVMPELRAAQAAVRETKPQTLDEVAARKAALAEQLALLKKRGAA